MPKKEVKRNYNISDGGLKQEADFLVNNINRDNVQFAARGVTNATVLSLKGLITSFDDAPTDFEFIGPLNDATNIQETAANQLRSSIRTVRNMAENKFHGVGSYKSFGFKDMTGMSHNDLYILVKEWVELPILCWLNWQARD